ncbi:MAG: MAPEG family protein, partial [SAR86 cluster bacterium]
MLSSINTEVVRNMGMHGFEYLTIVTLLALIQFIWLGARVGAARGKYGVSAPATTGHDLFERHYRVHYNTLEALVVFLPALWAFGYYLGQYWAAGLGVVYLVGRVIYAISYVKDPKSRGMGMLLSSLPVYILLLG